MTRPVRLQLSRKKGFNLQALSLATNGLPAMRVDRSTVFGNPCVCSRPYGCPYHSDFDRENWEDESGNIDPMRCCVDVYRHYIGSGLKNESTRTGRFWFGAQALAGYPHRKKLIESLPKLRGHNLACWCPLPKAGERDLCHAAVLIEFANREDAP